jgi:hypothetical protein
MDPLLSWLMEWGDYVPVGNPELSSPITTLPDEILIQIFDSLCLPDCAHVAMSCRRMWWAFNCQCCNQTLCKWEVEDFLYRRECYLAQEWELRDRHFEDYGYFDDIDWESEL